MRVVDFFSGAGGWSEGFRQQGFKVIMGFDNWAPAVKTHNLNHGLQDEPMDILIFENGDTAKIDEIIPEAEIIVGSPPCVSFSMSNNAGKADKTLGIRLIESYLRVVAYKKHKEKSILKAWYMENVPNSKNFVKPEYTFSDLKLDTFAKRIGKSPRDIALKASNPENGAIICAADYGSAQARERFVCGEILIGKEKGKVLFAPKTHESHRVTLKDIKSKLPSPFSAFDSRPVADPNYPNLELPMNQIPDHFYDTGVYEVEWEAAKRAKVDHPFMGKMSFPEDENRPSRTIMATRSASTREAIIYKSEIDRKGDGEYRLPTIREASSLMGFPITYQFYGSEGTKWRQIGNAVCPHMSAAIARELRVAFGMSKLKNPIFDTIENLNTFQSRSFQSPPGKKADSKFRRHPFKTGNMTVALVNFDPHDKNVVPGTKWYACAYIGSGKTYTPLIFDENRYYGIKSLVETGTDGRKFMHEFQEAFSKKIAPHDELQKMHVQHKDFSPFIKPNALIEEIKKFITKSVPDSEIVEDEKLEKIVGKKKIPKRQLYSMYALSYVASGAK
ncbi:MAG: DNA cytosine methyltransferase [Alphaproteobacteria bacterium]|nr:DNA cytosine methyltransferase [Alphaproteobacteria bacterium]